MTKRKHSPIPRGRKSPRRAACDEHPQCPLAELAYAHRPDGGLQDVASGLDFDCSRLEEIGGELLQLASARRGRLSPLYLAGMQNLTGRKPGFVAISLDPTYAARVICKSFTPEERHALAGLIEEPRPDMTTEDIP